MTPMKTITSSISGLASSLFLNVGLTQVAEKLDPMVAQHHGRITGMRSAQFCETCTPPCGFPARARR